MRDVTAGRGGHDGGRPEDRGDQLRVAAADATPKITVLLSACPAR
jgi:hypothetical protein